MPETANPATVDGFKMKTVSAAEVAEMERDFLDEGKMISVLLWNKGEVGEDGLPVDKQMMFPISRYIDVMNRPRFMPTNQALDGCATGEFLLVSTGIEEVDDETVFEYFGQRW